MVLSSGAPYRLLRIPNMLCHSEEPQATRNLALSWKTLRARFLASLGTTGVTNVLGISARSHQTFPALP
jgi:hypothetical protein